MKNWPIIKDGLTIAVVFSALLIGATIYVHASNPAPGALEKLPVHLYTHQQKWQSTVYMPNLVTGEYTTCQVSTPYVLNCGEWRPRTMNVYFEYSGSAKPGAWNCRRNLESLSCSPV
jgi:hypothetical protein